MAKDDDLLVLRGTDVRALLTGRDSEVVAAIRRAYCEHQSGHSDLPHSVFVRFPGRDLERIIALPGYLGGQDEVAGIKWVASFPDNVKRGMSRASAVVILNSMTTGRPQVILEGSVINAVRTAASAALAADVLCPTSEIDVFGQIGCGLINAEITRLVASLRPKIGCVLLFDVSRDRAGEFGRRIQSALPGVSIRVCSAAEEVLKRSSVISFATTSIKPDISDLSICRPNAVILHISLRDLTPDAILQADNIVDDVDHVMRAQTSVHLTEQVVGHRAFVRGTLADILMGKIAARSDSGVVVFSPFGLGVLDLALADMTVKLARSNGAGTRINGFFEGT
jgi:2,3-diaminopropionate biosynthesis protein SbnB